MFFLVASIGDVSESNQFLQASTHGTRPHWDFQHSRESITQHAV